MTQIKSEFTDPWEKVSIRAFSSIFRGRQPVFGLVYLKKVGVMPLPGREEKRKKNRNFRSEYNHSQSFSADFIF